MEESNKTENLNQRQCSSIFPSTIWKPRALYTKNFLACCSLYTTNGTHMYLQSNYVTR